MARNPDQQKGALGRFVRREQRPQVKDGKSTGSSVGLGDPNYVYRLFEKPSDTPEGKGRDKRLARLRDMGYVHTVKETESDLLLACPREEREKRAATAAARSKAFLERPGDDGDTISIEKERGLDLDE